MKRIDAALEKAGTFLLAQQGEDGAWRSAQYGALKDGFSLSPLVLSALLFVPPRDVLPAAWNRGADFVASLVGPDGKLQPGPFGLVYPIYTPSLALFVLSRPLAARHQKARDALVAYLRSRQLTEQHGWRPSDPEYGGWGYHLGDLTRPPDGQPRHGLLSSNLSATVFAVGALQIAGVPREDPVFAKARVLVERCQRFPGDGGFFFTPANAEQNKAGADERSYRSYGTMTADGIRLLPRVGIAPGDARYRAAVEWMHRSFDVERVPGDYPPEREGQRQSAYYYYAWSLGHVLMATGDRDRAGRLAEALLKRQQPDGTWRNPGGELKEDDPLIGTSLAIAGLGLARFLVSGQWRVSVGVTPPEAPPPRWYGVYLTGADLGPFQTKPGANAGQLSLRAAPRHAGGALIESTLAMFVGPNRFRIDAALEVDADGKVAAYRHTREESSPIGPPERRQRTARVSVEPAADGAYRWTKRTEPGGTVEEKRLQLPPGAAPWWMRLEHLAAVDVAPGADFELAMLDVDQGRLVTAKGHREPDRVAKIRGRDVPVRVLAVTDPTRGTTMTLYVAAGAVVRLEPSDVPTIFLLGSEAEARADLPTAP